jgi:hypothetical protein
MSLVGGSDLHRQHNLPDSASTTSSPRSALDRALAGAATSSPTFGGDIRYSPSRLWLDAVRNLKASTRDWPPFWRARRSSACTPPQ